MRFNDISFFDGRQMVMAHDNVLQPYDGSNLYNIRPISVVIDLTSSDTDNVTWNNGIATVTHSLNCIPLVTVFDYHGEEVHPCVRVLSPTAFTLDFQTNYIPVNDGEYWMVIITYAAPINDLSPDDDSQPSINVPYLLGNITIPGGYRHEIVTIPSEVNEYELSVEGVYQHRPQANSQPVYYLPNVTDETVTHEIVLSVLFSGNLYSYLFIDGNDEIVVPLTEPMISEERTVIVFLCRWENLLHRWTIMPVVQGVADDSSSSSSGVA